MIKKEIIDAKTLRKFSIGGGVIFAFLSAYWFYKTSYALSMFVAGIAALLLIGLFAPSLIMPLYKGWMGFARILGLINTRILLFLVFVLVVVPIGIMLRLLKKDVLDLKIDRSSVSYWQKRQSLMMDVKRYERHY